MNSDTTPIFDLDVLRPTKGVGDSDRAALCKMIVNQYLRLPVETKMKTIFVGDKQTVILLLKSDIVAANEIMKNPSITIQLLLCVQPPPKYDNHRNIH